MSRIILTKYPNGQQRFVVGWDHPTAAFNGSGKGCFWQEFNLEPEDWSEVPEDWSEVKRQGGQGKNAIRYDELRAHVPTGLKRYITSDVEFMLLKSAEDPDSGLWKPIDMTEASSAT